MSREFCYACRRIKDNCLCPTEPPMETRTRIVLLMHSMEWRREKCGTGRITRLNLANCEIIPGLRFDENPRVRELIDDPGNHCVLLYPGPLSINLSAEPFPAESLAGRRLVVFLVDATWACSRVVLRESPGLLDLPRMMFDPEEKSRWLIKRQPKDVCLSTLETVHELLSALEKAGLDSYPDKERLLESFLRMQEYQIMRAKQDGRPRFLSKKRSKH